MSDYPDVHFQDDPMLCEDDGYEEEHYAMQLERELYTLEMLLVLKHEGIALDTIEYLAGELGLHAAWLKYQTAHHPNLTRSMTVPNIDQMISSKYLTKTDVGEPGDGTLVTIQALKEANIARDDEEPKMKWLIKFREFAKPMVLGSTTLQLAAMILGSKSTDDWIGKKIEVYHDPSITFGDKLVGGIRFRKQGKTNTRPETNDDDSSIPF